MLVLAGGGYLLFGGSAAKQTEHLWASLNKLSAQGNER